ncbi:MAG: hypothetical protein AAFV98_17575, partial [Chloroflexota bacterium]
AFFYIASQILFAGAILGAVYGIVFVTIGFSMDGLFDAMGAGIVLAVIAGGLLGAGAGLGLGIIVAFAVTLVQAHYEHPFSQGEATLIGRVGDVTALVVCIGTVIVTAGSGEEVFFIGIPAIIAFLACHWIILHYLHKHTDTSSEKAKSI